MAELVQIVATLPNGECPVALTGFVAKKEAIEALTNFRTNGYGGREAKRPRLEARDTVGRPVPLEAKPKSSSDTPSK